MTPQLAAAAVAGALLAIAIVFAARALGAFSTQKIEGGGLSWESLERLHISAALVDSDGRVIAVNGAARRVFGLREPLPEIQIYDLIDEPDSHRDDATRNRTSSSDQRIAQLWRTTGTHTSGLRFPVEFTFGPAADRDGVLLYWMEDVGPRQRRVSSLKAMLDATAARTRFFATITQELRTPINAGIGYAEMLRDDIEEAGKTEYINDLDRILAAGRHALEISNAVVEISRFESGRATLAPIPVDVHALIEHLVKTLTPIAAAGHNEFEIAGVPETWVLVDRIKLHQLLLHVLGNACRSTQDETIRITFDHSRDDPTSLEVVIAGTAIPMPNPERGAKESASLGRRLAEVLGGDVKQEDEGNSKSRFILQIPAPNAYPAGRTASHDNPP